MGFKLTLSRVYPHAKHEMQSIINQKFLGLSSFLFKGQAPKGLPTPESLR